MNMLLLFKVFVNNKAYTYLQISIPFSHSLSKINFQKDKIQLDKN